VSAEQKSLELDLVVHVASSRADELEPDWRAVARPDFVVTPADMRGSGGHHALWHPVALLYQQSGRGNPDTASTALEHIVAGALLALARASRCREFPSGSPPPGLRVPVLVVGLPGEGWRDVANDGRTVQCRAWGFAVEHGTIRVSRSRGLTVGQAVALAARHVGATNR